MKKICHISTVHKSDDIRVFQKECCSLVCPEREVFYVTAGDGSESVINDVNVITVEASKSRFKRFLLQPFRIFNRARKLRCDSYHFHDVELWPIALLFKLLGNIVIADVHENVPAQIRQRDWIPVFLKPFLSWLTGFIENNCSRFVDGVIAADDVLANRFRKYNNNVVAIHNYPIFKEMPSRIKEQVYTVVSLGGFHDERCADRIVEAARMFSDNITFVIGGGISTEYKRKIEVGGLPNNLYYAGYLNEAQVKQCYADADLLLVMFSDQPNHIDIKSNRFFESLYAKKPVIVSNMPTWQSFIDTHKCGTAVNPESGSDLYHAIAKIQNDSSLAAQMAKNGHEVVLSRFNWEVEKAKLTAFYDSLCK